MTGETFNVCKEPIVLYQVDDVTAATLFSSLKNVLLCQNLSIHTIAVASATKGQATWWVYVVE